MKDLFFDDQPIKREIVTAKEMFLEEEFKNSPCKTLVAIGKTQEGKCVFYDLAQMPNLLIGGACRGGKTVFLNTMIASIIQKSSPNDVKFVLIDLKAVEFSNYENSPYLQLPIAKSQASVLESLTWVKEEIERRFALFIANNSRKIDLYNETMPESERLPKIVLVIDELADIMLPKNKKASDLLLEISRKGYFAGIHLVLSTQNAITEVVQGVLKANMPTRICFHVTTGAQSLMVLDQTGAEKLHACGDMLFRSPESIVPLRLQGAIVEH